MADLEHVKLSIKLDLDVLMKHVDENQQGLVVSFCALDDELLQQSQPKT
jgi:hypothetical protein